MDMDREGEQPEIAAKVDREDTKEDVELQEVTDREDNVITEPVPLVTNTTKEEDTINEPVTTDPPLVQQQEEDVASVSSNDERVVDRRRSKRRNESDSENTEDEGEGSTHDGEEDNEQVEEEEDDDAWVEDPTQPNQEPNQDTNEEGEEDAANSPMFVPKGKYYHHDSRFDHDAVDDDDNSNEGTSNQRKTSTGSKDVIEKWEHDLYDAELQKPREEWEKERDRKFYEELDRRRESGETGDRGSGRSNRGTRLGQYIPKRTRDSQERERGDSDRGRRGEGRGRRYDRQPDRNNYEDKQRRRDDGRRGYDGRRGDDGRRRDDGRRQIDSYNRRREDDTGKNEDGRKDMNEIGRHFDNGQQKTFKEESNRRGGYRDGENRRGKKWEGQNRGRYGDRHEGEWGIEENTKETGQIQRETKQSKKKTDQEDWDNEGMVVLPPSTNDPSNDRTPHSGSLFITKEPASEANKDVFTSKVFSLSSQTNRLIVKDISVEQRRPLGRGRGRARVIRGGTTATPAGLSTRVTTVKNDQDSKEETSKEVSKVNVEDNVEKDKDGGSSKPKRYSSRRQKGAGDGDGVEDNSTTDNTVIKLPPISHSGPVMSQPHPPYQWPQMFPAPVMMDPVAQQQMLMMMQQQMANIYQQQVVYHEGMAPPPQPMPMPLPQGAPVPAFIPSQNVPSHHMTNPVPTPTASNVSNGGNTPREDEEPNKSGLFIPPVAPEQQKMMQSAQTPKQSQAIPIVSPKNEPEKENKN